MTEGRESVVALFSCCGPSGVVGAIDVSKLTVGAGAARAFNIRFEKMRRDLKKCMVDEIGRNFINLSRNLRTRSDSVKNNSNNLMFDRKNRKRLILYIFNEVRSPPSVRFDRTELAVSAGCHRCIRSLSPQSSCRRVDQSVIRGTRMIVTCSTSHRKRSRYVAGTMTVMDTSNITVIHLLPESLGTDPARFTLSCSSW